MASSAVRDCGLIVEACRLDRSGPRIFQDDDESERRTGGPRTVTRHDRGLSTTIGRKRDARGTRSRQKRRTTRPFAAGTRPGTVPVQTRAEPRTRTRWDRPTHGTTRPVEVRPGTGEFAVPDGPGREPVDRSLYRIDCSGMRLRHLQNKRRSAHAGRIASVAAVGDEKVRNGYMVLNRELDLPVPPAAATGVHPATRLGVRIVLSDGTTCEKNRDGSSRRWPRDGRQPAGFAAGCVAVAAAKQREQKSSSGISPMKRTSHRRQSVLTGTRCGRSWGRRMFGLLLVVRYLRESDSETVVECRHCGTAVESSADRCATCGRGGS